MQLQYKNGRFCGDNFSFLLPDGFYYEADYTVNYGYDLCAWSPRRDFLCFWTCFSNCRGTAAELELLFTPEYGFTPLSPVAAIQRGGLSGHFTLYKDQRDQYYEARFDLGGGKEFVFIVKATGGDIRKAVSTPEFISALEGISTR